MVMPIGLLMMEHRLIERMIVSMEKEAERVKREKRENLEFIKKEDKHFFIPVMNYFNQAEQESMLEEEREFDRNFIHEIYKEKVDKVKKSID